MKILATILLIFSFASSLADDKSFIIDVKSGINENKNISIDGSIGFIFLGMINPNIGFSYNKYLTEFNETDNFYYHVYTGYISGNFITPINIYFGGQIGIDIVNVELIEPRNKYNNDIFSSIYPEGYFGGFSLFGTLGYNQKIFKGLSLILQSQLGVRTYKIYTEKYDNSFFKELLFNCELGVRYKF